MRSIVVILEQTQIWCGQDGRVYYVAELDDEYLGNVLAYLNRHAEELLRRRHELDDVDPSSDVDAREWLHERPLYRRLLTEQRRRASRRTSLDEAMTRIDVKYGDVLRRLGES